MYAKRNGCPALVGALSAALAVALGGCTVAGEKEHADLTAGFRAYSARQYAVSERAANTYIEKFKDDPHLDEAYYLRGLSRIGRGDTAGGGMDLNVAIQKTRRNDLKAKAYRALGDSAYDFQAWDKAIDLYGQALKAGSNDPVVRERLAASLMMAGVKLQAAGRWDDARTYFDRVMATSSDAALVQRARVRRAANAFELQFGAYADAAAARALVGQLKAAGVAATASGENRAGKMLYLVQAGRYRTLAEAEAARARLARFKPVIVP